MFYGQLYACSHVWMHDGVLCSKPTVQQGKTMTWNKYVCLQPRPEWLQPNLRSIQKESVVFYTLSKAITQNM